MDYRNGQPVYPVIPDEAASLGLYILVVACNAHSISRTLFLSSHINKVVKVLGIGRGDWVASSVGVREGIEEGVEGPLHQLHKWLLDWIPGRKGKQAFTYEALTWQQLAIT